jgi:hypothetical protein
LPQCNYTTAADCFDGWRDGVLTGSPPTFCPIAPAGALAGIEIGPGLVALLDNGLLARIR